MHKITVFNRIDKLIFIILSSYIISLFGFWVIVNLLGINDRFLWFLILPLSLFFSYKLVQQFTFVPNPITRNTKISYIVFFILLALVGLYLIEPVIQFPYATIGIPNKDLHDGIAKYISLYGKIPSDTAVLPDSKFIPNSKSGLYLGYPNVLHSFAAMLSKFGAFDFHTTWLATVFGLFANSIALFLLLKSATRKPLYSASVAGLSAISSFRISYGAVASIPMAFTYSLVIPTLLLCLFAIYNAKNYYSYLLPAIALAVISAAYTGIILLLIGLLALFLIGLLLYKKWNQVTSLLRLIAVSVPFIFFVFLFQHTIYWRNTFPTSADFDPFELSQRLLPLDQPLYMAFSFFSLLVFIYQLLKYKKWNSQNLIRNYLFVISVLFLLLVPYDLIFHKIHGTFDPEALVSIDPNGFFGGLKHQLVSRIALLQPYFFIIFLAHWTTIFKKSITRSAAAILVIALVFLIRIPPFFYNPVQKELSNSFYNQSSTDKPYTLLSHLRLIVNYQIWTKEIMDALEYLKNNTSNTNTVALLDERGWTTETITGWGSVYLTKPIIPLTSFGQMPSASYQIFIHPSLQTKTLVNTWSNSAIVFENSETLIIKNN